MDDRHIPDPDPSLLKSYKKLPRGKKGLVRDFVLKRLKEGRLTDSEIADECSTLFDGSTSTKAVQWYKWQFRQEGLIDKATKHRHRRRYLTEFTYEIIYKQLDPPDNVEVVNSKQLLAFAKAIVTKYAKALPKPIDEIIYDVRTAKHYLEATNRFEVIDQNNYENPFYYKEEDEEENEDADE